MYYNIHAIKYKDREIIIESYELIELVEIYTKEVCDIQGFYEMCSYSYGTEKTILNVIININFDTYNSDFLRWKNLLKPLLRIEKLKDLQD